LKEESVGEERNTEVMGEGRRRLNYGLQPHLLYIYRIIIFFKNCFGGVFFNIVWLIYPGGASRDISHLFRTLKPILFSFSFSQQQNDNFMGTNEL